MTRENQILTEAPEVCVVVGAWWRFVLNGGRSQVSHSQSVRKLPQRHVNRSRAYHGLMARQKIDYEISRGSRAIILVLFLLLYDQMLVEIGLKYGIYSKNPNHVHCIAKYYKSCRFEQPQLGTIKTLMLCVHFNIIWYTISREIFAWSQHIYIYIFRL